MDGLTDNLIYNIIRKCDYNDIKNIGLINKKFYGV